MNTRHVQIMAIVKHQLYLDVSRSIIFYANFFAHHRCSIYFCFRILLCSYLEANVYNCLYRFNSLSLLLFTCIDLCMNFQYNFRMNSVGIQSRRRWKKVSPLMFSSTDRIINKHFCLFLQYKITMKRTSFIHLIHTAVQ